MRWKREWSNQWWWMTKRGWRKRWGQDAEGKRDREGEDKPCVDSVGCIRHFYIHTGANPSHCRTRWMLNLFPNPNPTNISNKKAASICHYNDMDMYFPSVNWVTTVRLRRMQYENLWWRYMYIVIKTGTCQLQKYENNSLSASITSKWHDNRMICNECHMINVFYDKRYYKTSMTQVIAEWCAKSVIW